MSHLGGKTWGRRPADGDKSSELSVAEKVTAAGARNDFKKDSFA